MLCSCHQKCPLWARLHPTSSARRPHYFRLQADIAIGVLSESACRHCAYPGRVPLLLATPLVIHEKNWKCLDPQAQVFPMAPKEYFHRPKNSLNSCSQSGNSCKISLCTSWRPSFIFYYCFRFLFVYASGFSRSSSPALPLLSATGFAVYLLTSNTESCDEDDEVGVGVVEELVNKPGTTNGT